MRKQTEKGFALGIVLVVAVVVGLMGWLGYKYFTTASTQPAQSAQTAQTQAKVAAPSGTTASIDTLITQDLNSENGIDAGHASSDQAAAQDTTTAAGNVGGAYDESAF